MLQYTFDFLQLIVAVFSPENQVTTQKFGYSYCSAKQNS